jgi:hypothetical protein
VLVSDQFLQDYLPSGYKFIWAEFYDWMPNSHLLYFSTKTGISGPMTDIYEYDLFRANVDTGEVRQIIAPGSGGVPYFSTDGQTIALVQARAIYLANDVGSDVKKVLSFEPIYTGSEWIYLPVALPLPDGSGFKVAISVHGPPAGPLQPPEFWEISNNGQASLLYTFVNPESFGFRNLSPNGENIVYVKSKADQSSQICIHKNENTVDDCWFQQGKNGAFINWSPDSIHFVTADYSEENKLNFYLTDVVGKSIPINTYYFMYWVDTNRYFYVDKDLNLYLASINGDQTKIDKGIPQKIGKVDIWTWQFDFSY